MKNLFRMIGIIALVAIIGIGITACDNDNGNSNGNENTYLIMGKFANQAAGVNATFYADTVTSRSARAVAEEQELTGKIEDGDIIFNLKGIYFPADGSFILSAGSSILVYEIAGKVTNSGLSQTQATVKVNSGGDWVTFEIPVTAANEVSITGSASSQQSSGLPNNWLGSWNLKQFDIYYDGPDCDCDGECEGHQGEEYNTLFIITPFGFTNTNDEGASFPIDILEIIKVNDTRYDLVVQGEGGESSSCQDYPCGDPECCYDISYMLYTKLRLEQSNANLLKLISAEASMKKIEEAGSLAFVRAFNIDTAETFSLDLTR